MNEIQRMQQLAGIKLNELEVDNPNDFKRIMELVNLLQSSVKSSNNSFLGMNSYQNSSNLERNWYMVLTIFSKFKYPGPHVITFGDFLKKFSKPHLTQFRKLLFSKMKYPLTKEHD